MFKFFELIISIGDGMLSSSQNHFMRMLVSIKINDLLLTNIVNFLKNNVIRSDIFGVASFKKASYY